MGHFFDDDGSVVKSIHDEALWAPVGTTTSRDGLSVRVQATSEKNLSPTDCYSLSIAVNAAVNAIARNICKAKLRLFNRGGEEIVGGPLFDILRRPAPGVTTRKLLYEIISWLNISGEFAIDVQDVGQQVTALVPLSPNMLQVKRPENPRHRADVLQWEYTYGDGGTVYIRGDHLISESLFNPDAYSIRGLSPLFTGSVEVSGQYHAARYNTSYFQNGGIPSHLVVLPERTPRAQRQDFERRYLSSHGNFENNAHKVMVVAGSKDINVIPLEQPFQDGAFTELQKRVDFKVGQLFRVPAIEMGLYDKTRFDTAAEERKLFLESTLLPQMDLISEAFQYQLVDRFYRYSKFNVTRPRDTKKDFTPGFTELYEKAMEERGESNIIVLLDPDTMPIMADVMLKKMEYADKLQGTFKLSANTTAEYLKFDLPDEGKDEPARSHVWVQNNLVNLTDMEMNKKLVPGLIPKPETPAPSSSTAKPKTQAAAPAAAKKELTDDDKLRVKQAVKFFRDLRADTLRRMSDDQELWGLSDADALDPLNGELKTEIRKARYAIRQIIAQHADKDQRLAATKAYFNTLQEKSHLRQLLAK